MELKLEFHGSEVNSYAGLLPYRELDDAVRLTEIAGDVLTDIAIMLARDIANLANRWFWDKARRDDGTFSTADFNIDVDVLTVGLTWNF